MKKALTLIFSITCVVGTIIVVYKNSSIAIEEKSKFKFPEGTTFRENYTSKGVLESIDFQLPENSVMYGVLSDNTLLYGVLGGTGTLTCTCNGSGGCKPYTAGGKWGCIMDGCNDCRGTVSSRSQKGSSHNLDLFFIRRGKSDGFLELSALDSSRPIIEPEEWIELPFISNEDFKKTTFKKAFDKLEQYISNHSGDKGVRVSIPYVIEGKKMLIDVPYSIIEDGMIYTMSAVSGNISCSGTCSKGKCSKKTAAVGQVTYCDGCQSGCSLTISRSL